MKIKNLKYMFGFVFFGLFVFVGFVFGECINNYQTGSRGYPSECHSNASYGQNGWYDNSLPFSGSKSLVFLKIIGITRSNCSASTIGSIQTKMQQVGSSCSTCIDGRAGEHMRTSLESCVALLCTGELSEPKLSGENYSCEGDHKILVDNSAFGLSYKCCKQLQCDKYPDDGGSCASYGESYTVDGSGCCATSCDKPQDTTGGCASYGASYTVNGSGCCATSCDKPQDTSGGCTSYGPTFVLSGSCCIENQCSNPPDPETNECPQQGYFVGAGGCCETCTGNQYLSSGTCTDCTGDTIPNADHTKCVCNPDVKCCGIQLNTVVPFIGDCIEMDTNSSRGDTTSVSSVTAFPVLVQGLMKILMSAIMVFSFLMIIVAGLSMVTGAFGGSGFNKGKTILKNVIISLILLGCSGLILSLVNPSFFGG